MANQHSVNTERNEAIVRAYVEGMSHGEICQSFNISRGYVWELVKKAGVQRKTFGRKKAVLTNEIRAAIVAAYKSGATTRQLALDFDIAQATAMLTLKNAGFDLTRKHLTDEGRAHIIALYQSGLNTYQVAEQSGFSNVTVGKVVRAAGIKIRPTNVLTDEQQKQVLRDYEVGESSEQIAKRLGISGNTVRDAIKGHGGAMRIVWPRKQVEPGQLFNPNYDPQDLPNCKFSGIYKFTNKINGKVYVGQAGNIYQRYYRHREMRASGLFSKALKKYGIGNFKFEVLERVDDLILINSREQYWMDFYQAYESGKGYNLAKVAGTPRGMKRSPEVVAAMRERMLKIYPLNAEKFRKAVNQIDPKTEAVIKTWTLARDASRQLGLSEYAIQNVCRGNKPLYAGFKWEYVGL